MSKRNGDKARYQKRRKRALEQRAKLRAIVTNSKGKEVKEEAK